MKTTFLDFEQPIAELENRIEELRYVQDDSALDISEEIERLAKKSQALTKEIYARLTPWQVAQVARHPQRPYTLDYIERMFSGFEELHGDRVFADDPSIVGGLARFDGEPCLVLGHQKGRDTKEKILRNFGMPRPEGYRKALRLMMLAEKFSLPIFTFVDTPGAYPGIDAEERGQSEAIGRNLLQMAQLKVPIVVTVIGEGGSGGALAIAVGDAVTLGITASRLKTLGLIDRIVPEPPGGAHRDAQAAAATLKKALAEALRELQQKKPKQLVEERLERLMSHGRYKETAER
jgi:acetyl-CoA carboxylase carboxyl transferase subunit alpha